MREVLFMNQYDVDSLLIRRSDLIAADMDGETVMMSVERGEYFGINGIGTKVWALLEKPISIAQITISICSEYEIDAITCQADIETFIKELFDSDLITLA
jgi:hypothetical protein